MSSFTNQNKNSASWNNASKNISTYVNSDKTKFEQFLLTEDGGYLLQENGSRIILEQSSVLGNWASQTKH